ncbi:conserved hypothetical protein [Leishmania braziliensis MHOM/BR/75/M2904]|uniref:C2HC/C3H-type domain-containing protein n=2 Tax=Leishmania braziliensis TaxID=5660 RepID=A4H9B2_LEIBR|nr:conserved hypothetical protein [Leishmania braziliensis MHOM/BR/75/M2904]KAI5690922.1 zincfinger of a C2HCtype [Leishmania braziliensis]CAJ2470252.1 unnamed protein product [Leishmania braziliensis]CAM37983.1 conserved hypothetical protein [Leishmania braziliensis MHOM/BR/75/M2904]SYZ64635.1 zinc-finger_of_a_C2HC-type/Double_zinc_ribbon [Leishmania braziliensis MHOM/BR/75/M2904]
MLPALAGPKRVGHRPQFRVCYLCGQQFGSASIGIHVPQCYQKKLSQWEGNDPAIRGPKPKHPDTVKWKGGNGVSVEAINQEQYQEFNAQLVPCPHCARTFLPDRLPVHLRGCKGDGKDVISPSKTKAGGGAGGAPGRGKRQSEPRRSPRGRSLSPGPPLLPTCYLCGQQFGTASIGIHVPQCYEKRLAQWQNADPRSRGQPPKHPDTVNWRGRSGASAREQSEEQFQEFMNNLEACPNCRRRFLPDRLVVHLRSCRPDNPATAASPSKAKASGGLSSRTPTTAAVSAETVSTKGSGGDERRHTEKQQESRQRPTSFASEDRLHPKHNRLPCNSALPAESRVCPQCGVVEYDTYTKFCRDCGHHFVSKQHSNPCQHCGEDIPRGSCFCGTCGQPVQGAPSHRRTPGGTNEGVSTARRLVCPACEALSDADGNFCDNCGAALGDADVAPATAATAASPSSYTGRSTECKTSLYCANCKEAVEDKKALFCEDCGGRLEVLKVPPTEDGGSPDSCNNTLPVTNMARLSTAKVGKPQESTSRARAKNSTLAATNVASPTSSAMSNLWHPQEEDGGNELPAHTESDVERLPCRHCGRRFVSESLGKHEHICASLKKRRVFNATKQRLAEGATAAAKVSPAPQPKAPTRDWKAESVAFRRAIREARHVDQVLKAGGTIKDLPPPTYSINPDYVPCPHCQRRFAPDVAARHIPRCANTVNRPKPPPRRR